MPAPHGLNALTKALLIRQSFRPSLPALCAMALGLPLMAQAQSLPINIQAQPLGSALQEFGRQTNLQVLYSPAEVSGLRSTAVSGDLEPAAAMARLLQGTNITYSVQGNSMTLNRRGNGAGLDLAPINISGTQESAWGPVDGIVAKKTGTGTKTDTPLNEVPQTVNVITQDEVKLRGAQSVTEALRYTAGMTGGGFSDRVTIFDEPTSRGFIPTPLYLDGLHLPYGGGSTGGALQIDPYTLERIEVLKGPASVLYGQNQPGGIVNMVSKRPTVTPLHEVTLGAGDNDRKKLGFDLGGPLDDQGEFLYRLTGMVEDSGSEIDYVENNRMLLAPSLTWNPSDATSITLFAQYQKDRDTPSAQGLPASGTVLPNPNGKYSRSTFFGEPGLNKYNREQFVVGYEASHELNNVWTLKQTARYAQVDDQYVDTLHGYGFIANPVTGANDQRYMRRYGVDWSQTNKVYNIDTTAQAKFRTGELDHTVLLGVDHYHFDSKFLGLYDRSAAAIDMYNPVYGGQINFTSPHRWDNTIRQTGLYVQDQLKWDKWFFTVGGRYDFADTDNKQPLAGTRSKSHDEKFSGRAGFGYLFDNGLTPYVSYSESFMPVSNTNISGPAFEPTTGKQYEAGIKYEPKGIDGFIQLSVYDIVQENVVTSVLGAEYGVSEQSGEMRSQGIELEGKVNLNENIRMIGSVSRNDIEYTKDNDGRQGRHPASAPPLTASAWIDYTFTGASPLAGFGAGIGARYVRQSYGTDYEGAFQIPSYTVYDAMLSYDFEKSPLHIKGVSVRMNMENLEDKKYVASCRSDWDCYYGQGRTMTTDLTYNW
ncbi:TonB-dependent siderophore receptor [Pseudomonas fluorescens]|uniref:Metal-pseudopaline receptor CntO n=1 Tax=Pseudomonas fluorescens TaxID=294 RepID=A0A944DQN1_PSEFL|nr:TonB-dependent siderophore receptor [Pseudomonas fluorescens]MBT2310283.1 TonB-dependent siderophore receptor [Pseudomonas fluorescens]MBT2313392.1 TonB-dependent siderophore receptor [Pseudomonas fluorescens]MBT2320387.1 TonB-dependent siderophore receptor [Pseudomonas fluorescens]MBT2331065.1 TonB-dependent siderophore receptor [Pseudomonas fluorescens]